MKQIYKNNTLEIIKYYGTKHFFSALGKIDNKWFALIAPITTIDICHISEIQTAILSNTMSIKFPIYEDINVTIHFNLNENNNTYYSLISLKNNEDFNIVIATLESIYGKE